MGISISIVAGQDQSASSVNASGSVQQVITDTEKTTFRLGDKQLKDAVKAYFGKSPKDAYLHSPTPWNDLYETYNWPQVQRVLVVQSAEILEITSEPVIVKTQEFENNSSQTGLFDVAISDEVSNTTSSNWSTGGELSIAQSFTYGVKFLGAGAEGETSLSYSQSWGVGGQESTSMTVGSTAGVSVELEPGEAVVAKLSASHGTMKVRIRYRAYLIGNTAVNYNPTYKGHHFWSLGIGRVMSAGGLARSVESTEDIEIGYYSNAKVELKDKVTGALKEARFMADVPGQ